MRLINNTPNAVRILANSMTNELSNQQLIHYWETWATMWEPGAGEGREIALERLKACLFNESERLQLENLSLTELPANLPNHIKILNCSNNQLTDLPENLPHNLVGLYADANQLIALPTDLPTNLMQLSVNENRLIALPDNLPRGLKFFSANNNQLTYLSETLPDNMEIFYAQANQLTVLPTSLPTSLEFLYLSENRLTVLPDNLPRGLKHLYIQNNQLSNFPVSLPNDLRIIQADDNQLVDLSPTLPMNLKNLHVRRNRLTNLSDNLPRGLEFLFMADNQLSCLPDNLPGSLIKLEITNNLLSYLPDNLPNSLQTLELANNRLVGLPRSLPLSLESLNVEHNLISSLPETLPRSLVDLNVRNNLLGPLFDTPPPYLHYIHIWNNSITHLPDNLLGILDSFFGLNRSVTQSNENLLLANAIKLWDQNADPGHWEQIGLEEDAPLFASFLHKLAAGSNAQNSTLKEHVSHWLNCLSKDENSELRQKSFKLSQQAEASCVDRASFYFNKMHLLMLENEVMKTIETQTVEAVLGIILSFFRLSELEKIAEQHVQKRSAHSPNFEEDIEIYLAYQFKLREEFNLPIYTELQYGNIAGVTDEEVVNAKNDVLAQERENFLRYLVMESPIWEAKIQAWDAEKKGVMEENYSTEIDSDQFKKIVDEELSGRAIPLDDEDARRNISKSVADNLLYKKRYKLTKEFLSEKNALSLFDKYENHPN